MLDIAIAVALALATIGMAFMGVHVTLDQVDSQATKRKYRYGFMALAAVTVVLIAVQSYRSSAAQRAAQQDVRTAVASSEQRIRANQEKGAAAIRSVELQNAAQAAYLRGQLESQGVVIGSILKNSTPEQLAAALRAVVRPAAPPRSIVVKSLSTSLHDLDNNQVRSVVLQKVSGIRALLNAYDALSMTLSQEQYAAVERAVIDTHPPKPAPHSNLIVEQLDAAFNAGHSRRKLTDSQRDDVIRYIASDTTLTYKVDVRKLNTVLDAELAIAQARLQHDYFAAIPDPLMPKTLNDSYTTKELGNLQTLIDSFQSGYKVDAAMYRDEMLSRLPAGVANTQINYGAVPVAPSQIVAIADDLERLAKLLPSKPVTQ